MREQGAVTYDFSHDKIRRRTLNWQRRADACCIGVWSQHCRRYTLPI
ncbi:MAG: hypothetical protein R2856_08815 [Caldilineaceae bacterium]